MKTKLTTGWMIVIFVLSFLAITLILALNRVHAQDKAPAPEKNTDPQLLVVQTDQQGVKWWVGLVPKDDVKLYCFDGKDYVPCEFAAEDKAHTIIALKPIKDEEEKPEEPVVKPTSVDEDIHRAKK